MSTRNLLEQRAAIVSELRAMTANGADLSDEQRGRFDTLKADADALQGKIDRAAVVDDFERRVAGSPITGSGDKSLDTELRNFSLVRAIASQVPGLNVDAGRERELSQEIARRAGRPFQGMAVPMAVFEQRVLTTTAPAGGPGGNIIATDYRGDQFIDLLRNALIVRQRGARVLSGLTGNVEIPRLQASATAGWVAENSALPTSDHEFGKVSMSPKHAGCITELSRNLLMQASPDVESLVRADFAKVLAETLDRAALAGTGLSNQPLGILNTAGIGNVAMGTNGGALTYDAVVNLMGEVEDNNADGGNMAFVSNMKVKRAAMKVKDGDGNPLGSDVVFQGVPRAFSNVVPSNLTKGSSTGVFSALIYGNWSDLLIGYWSELDILVNPFEATAYSKGNVQVRGMMTCDTAVRHPESFAAIQDLTT
jgi:HK97 family phage major capsid protein